MSYTTWPHENALGFPALDTLHRDLFNALDKLSATGDSLFVDDYCTLVRQFEQAFCEEEQWMEELDFPSMKVHREQHARVLGALHNVHARVMDGELGLGRDVVSNLLPQWLAFHISTMDRTLAIALQMKQAPIEHLQKTNNYSERYPLLR